MLCCRCALVDLTLTRLTWLGFSDNVINVPVGHTPTQAHTFRDYKLAKHFPKFLHNITYQYTRNTLPIRIVQHKRMLICMQAVWILARISFPYEVFMSVAHLFIKTKNIMMGILRKVFRSCLPAFSRRSFGFKFLIELSKKRSQWET